MGARGTRLGRCAWILIPAIGFLALVLSGCQSAPADAGDDQLDQPPAQPAPEDSGEDQDQTDSSADSAEDEPAAPDQADADTPPEDPNDADDEPEDEQPADEEQNLLDPDLNGDGAINGADGDVFAAALNTEEGQEGFDPDLDFDGDGLISLVDRQIWQDLVDGAES